MRLVQTAVCLAVLVAFSCGRDDYRKSADEDVNQLIQEKSGDPRWALDEFSIDVDPRSRYYDPHDPDRPPMPVDDPASHELMVSVDGSSGYSGWEDFDVVEKLENPEWRQYLEEEYPLNDEGKIVLRLEDALALALLHSPDYQEELETMYLSALDVNTERFRFDWQFFGGFGADAQHRGALNGGESNTVEVSPFATLSRRFSTAGELVVSFVNSIGWEFFGPNDGFSMSQIGFSFLQPLLRGGGKVIALEQLTIAERTLLANLRAFRRYRHGFYTEIAIGESGVSGPQRRGGFFGGTGLTGFTGQGGGGFGGVGAATGFGRGGFGG
ncbi:MAG: hypothetical protein AAF517_02015, partial [Planctomycetota bacterium]